MEENKLLVERIVDELIQAYNKTNINDNEKIIDTQTFIDMARYLASKYPNSTIISTKNYEIVKEISNCVKEYKLALVGDGYTLEDVNKMSDEEVMIVWKERFCKYLKDQYYRGKRIGLYE